MTLTEIPLYELPMHIEAAFEGDTDLPQYHIHSGSQLELMYHTFATIKEAAELLPLTCYAVDKIGFTVLIEPNKLLYSFGINKKFRNKEILSEWFSILVEKLGTFDCALWSKNTRAIRHLQKQGMVIKSIVNDYIILTTCR